MNEKKRKKKWNNKKLFQVVTNDKKKRSMSKSNLGSALMWNSCQALSLIQAGFKTNNPLDWMNRQVLIIKPKMKARRWLWFTQFTLANKDYWFAISKIHTVQSDCNQSLFTQTLIFNRNNNYFFFFLIKIYFVER